MSTKIIILAILILLTLLEEAQAQGSIYRITADNKVQTGFKAKGIPGIITALHGVAGSKSITVEHFDSKRAYRDEVRIIKIDYAHDICILSSDQITTIPRDQGYPINIQFTNRELKGRSAKIDGFPLGIIAKQNFNVQFDNEIPIVELESFLPPKVGAALRERKSPDLTDSVITLHGFVLPGHSGAPVIYNNEVIGMADGGLSGGTMGQAWAIILKKIKWANFIKDKRYNDLALRANDLFSYEFAFPENTIPEDFINTTATKADIAVLVIDSEDHPINSISSGIANIYRTKGRTATSSLFKPKFLTSDYLEEIQNSNSQLLNQLDIPSHVNYLVIGKYSNTFESGEYTKYISRARLDIVIISCSSKLQLDSFSIRVANGFDDQDHAELGAIEKLLQSFKLNHSNF